MITRLDDIRIDYKYTGTGKSRQEYRGFEFLNNFYVLNEDNVVIKIIPVWELIEQDKNIIEINKTVLQSLQVGMHVSPLLLKFLYSHQ